MSNLSLLTFIWRASTWPLLLKVVPLANRDPSTVSNRREKDRVWKWEREGEKEGEKKKCSPRARYAMNGWRRVWRHNRIHWPSRKGTIWVSLILLRLLYCKQPSLVIGLQRIANLWPLWRIQAATTTGTDYERKKPQASAFVTARKQRALQK